MTYIVYSNTDYGIEMLAERATAASAQRLVERLNREDPFGSYGYSRVDDDIEDEE